jgi:hypothetical protein
MDRFGSYRMTLSAEGQTGRIQLVRLQLNAWHRVVVFAKWNGRGPEVCDD